MSGDVSDISGAVGDLGLGAAAAKAAEPDTGGSSAAAGGSENGDAPVCLNCGTVLIGAHCHTCGQKAKIHRTLGAFLHDLVHGVLHFEGKFWRTLPLLAWHPGRLMREYIDGKRARYVSPIALFLFAVFISFAVFNMSGGFGKIEPQVDPVTLDQIEKNLAEINTEIDGKRAEIAAAQARGEPVTDLEAELQAAEQGRDLLKQLVESGSADSPNTAAEDSSDGTDGDQGSWIATTFKAAASNPGLLVYKLQTNAYKLSWLLIPLSLPFVWLLFPFSRKFRMYDHTVFVTYSISFMTMLAVVLSFGIAFSVWPLVVAPLLYAPFHLYRSLKGTYHLNRWGAIWRMAVLSAGIWLSICLFVAIMLTIVISG